MTGKKKTTYVYKTADELIAKGGSKRKTKEASASDSGKSKHSQVKVIDMTGKEQRVLSGTLDFHYAASRIAIGTINVGFQSTSRCSLSPTVAPYFIRYIFPGLFFLLFSHFCSFMVVLGLGSWIGCLGLGF